MAEAHNTRSYAPDFVSADTLAYRLDCSTATIDVYVRDGRLPKPQRIGNLVRWDFDEVRRFIKELGTQRPETSAKNGVLHQSGDPYIEALTHGPTAQR